ncbi:hypothetical protein DYB32_001945 [Aphanomyces invadans]|uniref:Mitochondrial inner membrane protease ATP23 n=1 Tax=Aphanomyces invadans TaxID=157072 RepID=A0A418B509_9STRA|nr:hypothetical protein DYB32_001945 [Aphanomyces invadans]
MENVTFLVQAMEKMGCKVKDLPDFFSSEHCEGNINGGFKLNEDGQPGVVLCQNHIKDQEWMDRTLAHELIHAYDHCRAQVDWKTDCDAHACSEIRAAALSGDCDWHLEVFRGHFNIAKQHQVRSSFLDMNHLIKMVLAQVCVRRRAELSLKYNPMCTGKETSCVDKVFETCYKDHFPFSDIPK